MAQKISKKQNSFVQKYFLHEKTMRSFLRSYILVFMIPVLLVYFVMFFNGYRSVRRNNLDGLRYATMQARQQMDNQLYSLFAISTTIDNNSDFLNLINRSESELDESSVMSMYHLSDYFRQMYSVTNQFSQMALHMSENGYCVTHRNALPVRSFEDLENLNIFVPDEAAWMELTTGDNVKPTLRESNNSMMYCVGIPSAGQRQGTLLIQIRSDYMRSLFASETGFPMFGGVVSGAGERLYSYGLENEDWSLLTKDEGEGVLEASGNVYVYEKLSNADAYIVLGVQGGQLNANFWTQNMFMIPMMAVTILLFALLTFRCAVRNYDPIKKLCSLTAEHSDAGDFDAMQSIRSKLLEAVDIKRAMENSKNLLSEVDRGTHTFRSLRACNANRVLEKMFEMSAEEVPNYSWVCVRAVLADRFSGLFRMNESEGASLDWMPLFSDCLQEMLGEGCRVLPMFQMDSLVFLIRSEGDVNLRRILPTIRELLMESYTYETCIAVSETVRGVIPFEKTFRWIADQCLFLIENNISAGENNITYYADEFATGSRIPREAIALHAHLSDKLRQGEAGEAQEILARMNQLLCPAESREEAESGSNNASKSSLAEWIRSIVDGEYTDSGLSVGAIADRAGRSPDYISRCFRQKYDIGLLDYIHRMRIARAKELLCDASVGSVAPMVGYTSVDSFIRVFKKLEGVTPGKYQAGEKME